MADTTVTITPELIRTTLNLLWASFMRNRNKPNIFTGEVKEFRVSPELQRETLNALHAFVKALEDSLLPFKR